MKHMHNLIKYINNIWLHVALLTVMCTISTFAQANCCECTYDCDTNFSCPGVESDTCRTCHIVYLPRSQNSNSAYFWFPYHKLGCESKERSAQPIIVEFGIEYQRSFNNNDIAQCLFGKSCLQFQGSQVADRDPRALIADYFGLSDLFNGTLKFDPHIRNANFHFQSYADLHCICKILCRN